MKKIVSIVLILMLLSSAAFADLEVYFLDVGQGDATVLLCDGESMMIDGGPSSASRFIYTFLRKTLRLDHLDYMISTHPHEDHVGGLGSALNAVPVDLILSPVTEWNTKVFTAFIDYAEEQGTPVVVPSEGDVLMLGGAKVTVLHCWPEAWSANDMSIVVRVDYGDVSFLLAGDAEEMSEYMMCDSQAPLQADVLRVAHHGSASSSSQEFLDAVSPTYSVISCGAGNEYDHPRQETLNRLRGTELFRTDLQGTIHCVTDGKNIDFRTERHASADLYQSPELQAAGEVNSEELSAAAFVSSGM